MKRAHLQVNKQENDYKQVPSDKKVNSLEGGRV